VWTKQRNVDGICTSDPQSEEAVSAAQRLAQRQDVRLCKAKRKVQAAQRRLQQIVQIDHEISVQIDHELSEAWKLPAKQVKPPKKA
jgi:hypothetical protein